MTEEELKEILNLLEKDGWNPKLCDTKVPFYDAVGGCFNDSAQEEVRFAF